MDSISEFDITVPRSCWACHRKKVKCSRDIPCKTCEKSGTICEYPKFDQRKKSRRFPVNALLSRLAQLEKKVSALPGGSSTATSKSEAGRTNSKANALRPESSQIHGQSTENDNPGVLLNQGGDSRYFGESFIASIAQDAKELSPTTEQIVLSGDDFPAHPPADPFNGIHVSYSDQAVALDPRSGWRALRLWQLYQANVEPLLKILHAPSTQNKIYAATQTTQPVPDTDKMLLAAICFAAMCSLDDEESLNMFNLERQSLLHQYRGEVEKYVGKMSLMTAPNMEYLQALTIFITTLRVIDTSRAVWILTGLAVRVAQSLGIHMDGAAFNISPFDSELRRRIWWHLFLLEIRAAEDHGLLVSDFIASKKPPLYPSNINDDAIWPGMTEPPKTSQHATSMSLTIIRIQLADAIIHIGLYPVRASKGQELLESIRSSRSQVKHGYDKVKRDWLSTEEHKLAPYFPAASQLLDFSRKKAEFLIYFRAYQTPLLQDQQKEEIREQTVINALALIEGLKVLAANMSLKRFFWYSRSHPQWFTVGFLLQQLYRGLITDPAMRQRVRNAIEDTFELSSDNDHSSIIHRRGAIWVALKLLKEKALGRCDETTASKTIANTSSTSELATPESTDLDALDSMFDFNMFDFSQLPPMDLAMFDADINFDLSGFDMG